MNSSDRVSVQEAQTQPPQPDQHLQCQPVDDHPTGAEQPDVAVDLGLGGAGDAPTALQQPDGSDAVHLVRTETDGPRGQEAMELGDGGVVPCLSGPMGAAAILVRAHGDAPGHGAPKPTEAEKVRSK